MHTGFYLKLSAADIDRISMMRSSGVIAITAHADIAYVSEYAASLISSGCWPMSIDVDNRLRLRDEHLHVELLGQLQKVAREEIPIGGVMVPRAVPAQSLILSVTRLNAEDGLLLTIRDPSRASEHDCALLRRVFGFTRREAELASHLACGLQVRLFTAQNHLTANTVKSHLKQIFKKARVRSQMELVTLVLAALR